MSQKKLEKSFHLLSMYFKGDKFFCSRNLFNYSFPEAHEDLKKKIEKKLKKKKGC